MRNSAMFGLSSRFVASTSCGRTSPVRSIACAIEKIPCWSYRSTPRQRLAPPLTRGELVRESGSRPYLLAVELDDELLLRRDRDAGPLRALEHPAAEGLAVHGDPGE